MVFLRTSIPGIPNSLAEIIVSGLQITDEALKQNNEKLKCWPLKHSYDLFSWTSNATAVSSPNTQ